MNLYLISFSIAIFLTLIMILIIRGKSYKLKKSEITAGTLSSIISGIGYPFILSLLIEIFDKNGKENFSISGLLIAFGVSILPYLLINYILAMIVSLVIKDKLVEISDEESTDFIERISEQEKNETSNYLETLRGSEENSSIDIYQNEPNYEQSHEVISENDPIIENNIIFEETKSLNDKHNDLENNLQQEDFYNKETTDEKASVENQLFSAPIQDQYFEKFVDSNEITDKMCIDNQELDMLDLAFQKKNENLFDEALVYFEKVLFLQDNAQDVSMVLLEMCAIYKNLNMTDRALELLNELDNIQPPIIDSAFVQTIKENL